MDRSCRILLLGNNALALRVLVWLGERGEKIAGLAIHPQETSRNSDEMVKASGLTRENIRPVTDLGKETGIRWLEDLAPDLGVCVGLGYILSQAVLDAFPMGCINLHTGYLPFNRGANPNVWTIVDGTPSGVTLHYMDKGVDTGDLIAQVIVPTCYSDTGESLYKRLQEAAFALLVDNWNRIKTGTAPRTRQGRGGTFHREAELKELDEIHPDSRYRAIDLLNRLRARTFPPYPGCWIRVGGKKYYLRLEVVPELDPEETEVLL